CARRGGRNSAMDYW
nr:immunoglobulin heavy chain junction region [Mus musculus]